MNRPYFFNRRARIALGSSYAPWFVTGGIPPANCIGAYKPKGASSLAASYINLASPGTYNAAPGTAPNWDIVGGWLFHFGTVEILTTGITIANNNWTVIVRCQPVANTSSRAVSGNADTFNINPTNSGVGISWVNGGTHGGSAYSTADRVFCIAGANTYLDGVSDGAIATSALSAGVLYIGNRVSDGARPFPGYIKLLSVYNIVLPSAQVVALTNAMKAL